MPVEVRSSEGLGLSGDLAAFAEVGALLNQDHCERNARSARRRDDRVCWSAPLEQARECFGLLTFDLG